MESLQLAFLGLGVMGYPMAGHLARSGHRVTVYNRSPEKAARWLSEHRAEGKGGHGLAATPKAAAEDADIVFLCVGADKDVEAVLTATDGAIAGLRAGTLIVDHTTASADLARRMAAAASDKGIGFVDAPVSGGEAGAVNGALTVMCGGTGDDYSRADLVMQAYARSTKLLGPVGAGQLAKMVNQVCIAGVVQGLAEAITLSEAAGLDTKAVLDVISKGAAQSWQMENRGHTMVDGEFEFGFAVDWMRKDLGIVLDEARRQSVSLPLTALVDQFYGDVQAMGGNRFDTSSLILRLTRDKS